MWWPCKYSCKYWRCKRGGKYIQRICDYRGQTSCKKKKEIRVSNNETCDEHFQSYFYCVTISLLFFRFLPHSQNVFGVLWQGRLCKKGTDLLLSRMWASLHNTDYPIGLVFEALEMDISSSLLVLLKWRFNQVCWLIKLTICFNTSPYLFTPLYTYRCLSLLFHTSRSLSIPLDTFIPLSPSLYFLMPLDVSKIPLYPFSSKMYKSLIRIYFVWRNEGQSPVNTGFVGIVIRK